MGQVLSAATARRINGSGNGGNGGGSEGSRNKQESPYRYENVTRVSPNINCKPYEKHVLDTH